MLYCLDLSEKPTSTKFGLKAEPINLLSSIIAYSNNNWRWLHTKQVLNYDNMKRRSTLPPGHSGWELGISNVGQSQQPFIFRTFWLGFSGEIYVDCDASLMEALKLLISSLELLKCDWVILSELVRLSFIFFSGDWFDLAPSGEFPTLNR